MNALVRFGDPARFAVTVGWADDPEPVDRRPAHGGWSMGVLGLDVGNHSLTRHVRADGERSTVTWYLLPVFEWLCAHWVSLLHEERFSWLENSADSAATATFFRLRRLIDADDTSGRSAYRDCRSWWMRHALRASDSSALYPDVFARRFGDAIEVSWTARQPDFAPDGFRFVLEPGAATLPVADVAGPLWEALCWFVSTAPVPPGESCGAIERLEAALSELGALPTSCLEASFLTENVRHRLQHARQAGNLPDRSVRMEAVPAVEHFDDPVLMFGGVDPEIGPSDATMLVGLLASHFGGADTPALSEHVDPTVGAPLTAPYEEGYDLAETLLDALDLPAEGAHFIAIERVLADFGIEVVEHALETDAIRGVAIAGEHYAPVILVNTTSPYNETETGRRFTLAHELFHILYDRTRARRVAHTSGPWAAASVEMRANAFAAMFLMPGKLIQRALSGRPWTYADVTEAAAAIRIGSGALIEHLHNIDLIDAVERERLRSDLQRPVPHRSRPNVRKERDRDRAS